MRKLLIYSLSTALVLLNLCSCKTPTASPYGCDVRKTVDSSLVLHPGDGKYFILNTPIASNDCEANYSFIFEWADASRSSTDNARPPLRDLAHAFEPADEFAYFGHPPEVKTNVGGGWYYVITFSVGNKNSGLSNTRYGVVASIDPALPTTPADSVRITCVIDYTPY